MKHPFGICLLLRSFSHVFPQFFAAKPSTSSRRRAVGVSLLWMPLTHPEQRTKAGGGSSHEWWHTMGWEAAIWMLRQ
eukprot:scaffold76417_cov39-Tisochrysis_lutea.AAC.1